MSLHREIKHYKDGQVTDEIIYSETTTRNYIPEDNVTSVASSCFTYEVEHPYMAPALMKRVDGLYIVPQNIKVHPQTTIKDIKWIRPVDKVEKVVETFESGSGMGKYKTTYNPNNQKFSCSCMGFWRSKGNCKHVQELKSKI